MSFRRPVNAAERLALRQSFIPADARPVLEHTNGSAAYIYEARDAFYAIAFRGTAGRPEFHYRHRTAEARDLSVWNFRESVNAQVERRAARAKAERVANTLKVGDIVNTSWGYDQTNVDFYVVTRASRACVWVRAIASDSEATGHMTARVWPAMPIQMTGEETRHVVTRGSSFSINGHHASLSEGRTLHSSSYA